jgi:DNA helicase HerA-like ATPase
VSANPLSPRTRLFVMVVYVASFSVVCRVAQGSFLPPADQNGLWFYAAIAALLLGGFIDQPFFTKPNDAMSNAVGAAIAILPVAIPPSNSVEGASIVRYVVLASIAIVIVSSAASLWFISSSNGMLKLLSRLSARVSGMLGAPRVLFSAVFVYALWAFHSDNPWQLLILGTGWVVLIAGRPLESLIALGGTLHELRYESSGALFGGVIGRQIPGIILVKHPVRRTATLCDVVAVGNDDRTSELAIALDHVGTAEGRWLRCVTLPVKPSEKEKWLKQAGLERIEPDDVWHFGRDPNPPVPGSTLEERKAILGIVAPETDINELRFEVINTSVDLAEGDLVSARVGSQDVLYQILNGLTKEEIVQQKNTRGFVIASARKVGVWDAGAKKLKPTSWLPSPNALVSRVEKHDAITHWENIGYLPSTTYGITVNPSMLVTHSTAILGVLGSGKSLLACELVERMAHADIKAIVLDLSNQYGGELLPLRDPIKDDAANANLQTVGVAGKTQYARIVAEGGSIRAFEKRLYEQFKAFLTTDGPRKVRVINPAAIDVWRQDSKMYDNAATMARLTAPEITRAVAEALLQVTSELGMTEEGRVCLVLEEAHSLVPEFSAIAHEDDKTATNGTAKALLQGRKFGFGCLLVTQRTANVTKSILNQCNTVFALQVFDATGMEFLRNYIGDDHARILSALPERHAVAYGRGLSCATPVVIRLNNRAEITACSPLRNVPAALPAVAAVQAPPAVPADGAPVDGAAPQDAEAAPPDDGEDENGHY